MPPPRSTLDPEGYYDRLGLKPTAPRADIVAAFRAKARLLHPDVLGTGNAAAFVAVKQAYDVLSKQDQRQAYDRAARAAHAAAIRPEADVVHQTVYPAPIRMRHPRFSDLPILVWAGVAGFLGLCLYQVATHLLSPSSTLPTDIRPNAAIVAPLSPSAHREVMYGPTPRHLPGTPNFYVVPAASPAVVWRIDPIRDALVPMGQLPLFSTVEAVRLVRETGMLEVLVNAQGNGFISADHLIAGNAVAARRAYCGYNAGPAPINGEVLQQRGAGDGVLELRSRAMQPVVVKLRNDLGAVVLSVFLGPGGQAKLGGLPEGIYHPDFAIGELWSRACNVFAAGMQARRIKAPVRIPGDTVVVTAPDSQTPAAAEISEQTFGHD